VYVGAATTAGAVVYVGAAIVVTAGAAVYVGAAETAGVVIIVVPIIGAAAVGANAAPNILKGSEQEIHLSLEYVTC
jgi:hypothetical protein